MSAGTASLACRGMAAQNGFYVARITIGRIVATAGAVLALTCAFGASDSNSPENEDPPRIVHDFVLDSPIVPHIGPEFSHNDYASVAREVRAADFQKLQTRILKVPEQTKLSFVFNRSGLMVGLGGLSRTQAESLGSNMTYYVESRYRGHTARFALESQKQQLVVSMPETNQCRAALFKWCRYLPRDWVKDDPFQTNLVKTTWVSTNEIAQQNFVVIDGEIAWTYSVLAMGEYSEISEWKHDAQEYDPKLRPIFEAVRLEAKQNLAAKGVQKRLGYVHAHAAEMKSILQQRHGITWRTFQELNRDRGLFD